MQQRHNHKKGFKRLPSCSEAIGRNARRGFNLIEAAIVLGVVGLVIGGIWYSAAAMYENYKVNKTVEQSLMIYQCIKNRFPRLQCDYSNICLSSAISSREKETDFVGKIGCIPQDTKRDSSNPTSYYDTLYYDDFGHLLFVWFSDPGDGSARINIAIGRWPSGINTVGQCAKFANKIAHSLNLNDVWDIQTGINNNPNFLSMHINDWTTACKNSGTEIAIKFNPT